MNILQLSKNEQVKLAEQMGLSHEAWVTEMNKDLKAAKVFEKRLDSGESMPKKDRERFQKKIDGSNPN